MTLSDIYLLARKIVVGIIIFLVPLAIISGILWLLQNVLLR
ncbi:hypothetical protein [Foetidibacter luteolus]|nr:hypothetical protein [Foetidibacter luteolus]